MPLFWILTTKFSHCSGSAQPCSSWTDISSQFSNGRGDIHCFKFCLNKAWTPWNAYSKTNFLHFCLFTQTARAETIQVSSQVCSSLIWFSSWAGERHIKPAIYFHFFATTRMDFETFINVYNWWGKLTKQSEFGLNFFSLITKIKTNKPIAQRHGHCSSCSYLCFLQP